LGLGRDLTAAAPSVYDRALLLESYLRKYPYSLDVPGAPMDRDVSDYFLFDLRQGYCDYYATAMVVLARAAGVPARLVTGYASGQYDSSNNQYIVTAADAHSWAEVYFPGYGWVEFEPTAGLPAIQRQVNAAPGEIISSDPLPSQDSGLVFRPRWELLPQALGLLIGLFSLGALAWFGLDALRLRTLSPSRAVFSLFRRLQRSGFNLSIPVRSAFTPYEFSALLCDRMVRLTKGRRASGSMSAAIDEIGLLTRLYARSLYSPHPITPLEKSHAIQTWGKLRWKLLVARIFRPSPLNFH
jgi:hypothetical protein